MSCRKTRTNIGRYLDDELSAQERTLLEVHVRQCARCAAELAALRGADALMREDVVPPPPPELAREIMLRAERERDTNRRWNWLQSLVAPPLPMRFATAGAAVLAVYTGLLISGAGHPRRPAGDMAWLVAASRGPIVSAYQGVAR